MFSNIKNGWAFVDIEGFSGFASYLTNVPGDMLYACIEYYLNGYGIAAFDEEGSDFLIVLHHQDAYIIVNRKETSVVRLSTPPKDIVKEVMRDFESQIDDWVEFHADEHIDERTRNEYKKSLLDRMEILKELAG